MDDDTRYKTALDKLNPSEKKLFWRVYSDDESLSFENAIKKAKAGV